MEVTVGFEPTSNAFAERSLEPLEYVTINDKPRQHTLLSCLCGLQLVREPVVEFFHRCVMLGALGELSFSY